MNKGKNVASSVDSIKHQAAEGLTLKRQDYFVQMLSDHVFLFIFTAYLFFGKKS